MSFKTCLIWLLLSAFCFALPGDINGDGIVDWKDFAILADNWLKVKNMSYPEKLIVTGQLSPDISDAVFERMAEDFAGYPAWKTTKAINGEHWYIEGYEPQPHYIDWIIIKELGQTPIVDPTWSRTVFLYEVAIEETVTGNYSPMTGSTGTATVAEYEEPIMLQSICTLADVKLRLGIPSDNTEQDALLEAIIKGVEGIFNTTVDRPLIAPTEDVTEYHSPAGPYSAVDRFPIISITSVKYAGDYDFDSAEPLVEDTDYRIVKGGLRGLIFHLRIPYFSSRPDTLEIVYRGGYCAAGVEPGENEHALPDEITEVAIQQVTFFYKRKDDIGLSATGFQGGSISKFAEIDLLPGVKEVINKFKRVSI